MSHSLEEAARRPLKLPVNFNTIKPFLTPPVELDTATDIRFNQYVLCTNLKHLDSGDWSADLIGSMDEFLIKGKDEDAALEPCDFLTFYRRMLYEVRYPSHPKPNLTIWIQHHPESTPHMIQQTQEGWVTALQNYQASFPRDRSQRFIAWFYFQFTTHQNHMVGPTEDTILQVTRTPEQAARHDSPEMPPPGPAKRPQAPEAKSARKATPLPVLRRDITKRPDLVHTYVHMKHFSATSAPKALGDTGTRPPPDVKAPPLESPDTSAAQEASPLTVPDGARAPHPSLAIRKTASSKETSSKTPDLSVQSKLPVPVPSGIRAPNPSLTLPQRPSSGAGSSNTRNNPDQSTRVPKLGPHGARAPDHGLLIPKTGTPMKDRKDVTQPRPPAPVPTGIRPPRPSLNIPQTKTPSPGMGPLQDPKTPARPDTKKTGLVGRLRRASSIVRNKVKDGLRSPLDPIISIPLDLPEVPTILTKLASQAREGGVEDPDGLLPATQVPDQEEFFRYCSGYLPGVNPAWRDNIRNVRLKNCKLAVTPHQFCMAVKILHAEINTGIPGGLFASAPGTGKTYIVLFAYALRALLFESKRSCELEWIETDEEVQRSSKPSKKHHLPRDAPRGRGQACPSQKPGFGVCCYCCPDGLTRLTVDKLKPGVTLIQVPNGAMPSWLNAIKDIKFEPSVYGMVVFYGAAGMQHNVGAIESLKRGIKTGTLLPGQHTRPVAKNHMALESYCFLTSHHSSALDNAFNGLVGPSPQPLSVSQPSGDNVILALTGSIFIDESHQVMAPESKPVQTAQILHHYRELRINSDIWHVTATPFGAKFGDVMSAVKILAPQLTNEVSTLSKTYELAKSSDESPKHDTFENQFRKVFNDKLVIRDVQTTTFMGRPITNIQLVMPKYISSVIPESQRKSVQGFINTDLRDRLQQHLNKESTHTDYISAFRAAKITNVLYFLSLFPSMAETLTQKTLPEAAYQDVKLSELIRSLPDTTGEALAGCQVLIGAVDQLARGPTPPKVRDILNELKRQFHAPMERPDPNNELSKWYGGGPIRVDLTLKKTVIITPTFATAVFLYLYLNKYHRSYHPLLLHRDLKGTAKAAVVKKFDSLKKERDASRVLIAPANVAGTGLNLQVANRLILTNPLLNKADEAQALARVNRMGQTLPVELTILLQEESPIDRIIVADRAGRPITSDPLTLDQDLLTAGSDSEHDEGGPAQIQDEPLRKNVTQPVALTDTTLERDEYMETGLYD